MSSCIFDSLTLDTAYAAESLAVMVEKEQSFQRPNYLDPLRRECTITESDRTKIVDWCYSIVDHCKFKRETVSIAMEMVDRFLSTPSSATQRVLRNRKQLQLVAIAALYIAIKINEQVAFGSNHFAAICHGVYTVEDIEAMEMEVLSVLSWRVFAPTSLSFAHHILSLILPQVTLKQSTWQFILDEVHYQTEHATTSYFFATQRASTVAMAAIFGAIDQIQKHDRQAILDALSSVMTEEFASPEDLLVARNQLRCLMNGISDDDTVASETSKEVENWTASNGEVECYQEQKPSVVSSRSSPCSVARQIELR